MKRVVVALLALLVLGCGAPEPAPTATTSGLFVVLPLRSEARPALPQGAMDACAGVGLSDTFVHGNPADPHVVWAQSNGGRREVTWPVGYVARFVPTLEVIDPVRGVVLREGDQIDGACGIGRDGHLYLTPPFR